MSDDGTVTMIWLKYDEQTDIEDLTRMGVDAGCQVKGFCLKLNFRK